MESPSNAQPPRHTRGAFPRYSYLPGRSAHPRRDPRGHSWALPEPRVERVSEADWRRCETYLRGADLLNYQYFWESHEAFEALWRGVEVGPVRELLQALIQIGAAEIKLATGMEHAACRLAMSALRRLGPLPDHQLGVRVRDLERDLTHRSKGARSTPIVLWLES